MLYSNETQKSPRILWLEPIRGSQQLRTRI